MTQGNHNTQARQAAKAVSLSRATIAPAALTTLILSVLLGLLSGAVWMHAI